MKKYQETIYKIILLFSVLINIFLIGLLFFVLRDSFAGEEDWSIEGRGFWFFIGIILVYSLMNSIFIIRFLKIKSTQE
ncbi:hypothetical protein ACFO4P_14030 [Epilithonimonas pallida]|uniref:Uncharacterized protein n=1 Tax=Epilithonimonas pallida TaxID=373671 RepID=A0ABY1QXM4_9FLAO|nr:hypothetical protein [Epilithonimonas pallida]SMP86398.1 hypothetical protein SAMN05421679_101132 [Epilithonimonas pallida]